MKEATPSLSAPGDLISIIIADDRASFRKSLQALLSSTLDLRVVGSVENGIEAVNLSSVLHPDVVVMDVTMPVLNGLAATRRISGLSSQIRILILSAHSESEYIEEAMRCGASGYVMKQSAPALVVEAIRQVRKGLSYFAPSLAGSLKWRCAEHFAKGNLLRTAGETP